MKQLDDFTTGYIDAMLWAETDNSDESGGEPLDENYDACDIAEESLQEIIEDCKKFQEENAEDLLEVDCWFGGPDSYGNTYYSSDECAGHDFWLTRNGHGTGFWDRNYDEEVRDRLTSSSKKFGECWVYVGDDGKLYIS